MCFQSVKFNDFDDEATRWLCILKYIYKYDYVMDFNLMVMLRITTAPMDNL